MIYTRSVPVTQIRSQNFETRKSRIPEAGYIIVHFTNYSKRVNEMMDFLIENKLGELRFPQKRGFFKRSQPQALYFIIFVLFNVPWLLVQFLLLILVCIYCMGEFVTRYNNGALCSLCHVIYCSLTILHNFFFLMFYN